HRVQSFMKKDVVHSTLIGAAIGVVLSVLVLVVAHLAGWTDTAAGWVPFIFLAIVVLGFSTWEGGLFGIHKPNFHLARFEEHIKNDKHILFVDLAPDQEEILTKVLKSHPKLEPAGSEALHRHWFVAVGKKVPQFFGHTFPCPAGGGGRKRRRAARGSAGALDRAQEVLELRRRAQQRTADRAQAVDRLGRQGQRCWQVEKKSSLVGIRNAGEVEHDRIEVDLRTRWPL